MKIVLATPVYPPEQSSPAVYIKELALKLRDKHELTIVAYASTSERIEGTTLFTISKRRPLPLRLIKYFITLYNASEDADVIYAQNAMASGLPAMLVGKIRKIPVVIKYISNEGYSAGIRMSIQKFVLNRADAVTTPSAYMRDLVVKNYGMKSDAAKSQRVKVNFDPAIKDPEAPFPATPKPHQIITLAETSEGKGLEGIIHAVAILTKKYSDVSAVIAGEGSTDEKLKSLAVELGVSDRINFTGNISRAETLFLRKNSSVYVLNSIDEKVPNTVLTAFTAGIPIVAADIPATKEVVQDGVSGLLVPVESSENSAALATAISKIFDNPSLHAKLIKGGQEILKEKFSWEGHMKNLLEIFYFKFF